ncbi:MAG: protein phosphatase [Cyanobium sp.]
MKDSVSPPAATPPVFREEATACPSAPALRLRLEEFALAELVRQHRSSFQPLWTIESWAKLLIWLALNCGCSGDEPSLRVFAEALGPALSARLRRTFFERDLEEQGLRLLADPADLKALALPLGPGAPPPDPARVAVALEAVGLAALLAPLEHWQAQDGLLAIPWQRPA